MEPKRCDDIGRQCQGAVISSIHNRIDLDLTLRSTDHDLDDGLQLTVDAPENHEDGATCLRRYPPNR
jgi:hypothetical protein